MGYFVFSSCHTFLFQTLQTERLSPSPDHLLHFLEMIRFSLRFEIVQSLQPTSWTEIGNLVSCEADHKLCFQNFKVANHKHCWISTGTCKQSVKSINIFTILDPQGDNRNFSEIPHRFACVNISCYVHIIAVMFMEGLQAWKLWELKSVSVCLAPNSRRSL